MFTTTPAFKGPKAALLPMLFAMLVGCGGEDIPLGQEGGECRVTLQPCDGDLVCRDGCRALAEDEVPEALALEISVMRPDLEADGVDGTPIRFRVRDRETDAPFGGVVRVWVQPGGAGVLRDGLMTLDEGVGLTEFTACSAARHDCPAFAEIRFATERWPLASFGRQTVRLAGGTTFGLPVGVPGGMAPRDADEGE